MLWIYNITLTDFFDNKEQQLLNCVCNERKRKTMGYKNNIDKKLSLYSVLLLQYGLAHVVGGNKKETIEFEYSKFGKPRMKNFSNIDFNFSHTRNHIVCAISTYGSVGVDVEKIENPPYDIMKDFYHSKEMDYVNSSTSNRNDRFFEIWTRKEAFLKKIGRGLEDNIKELNCFNIKENYFEYMIKDYKCCICYDYFELSVKDVCSVTEEKIYSYFTKEKT